MASRSSRWNESSYGDLQSFLDTAPLSDGQRARLLLLQTVEDGICSRIEQLCSQSDIEVNDIAVLVVSEAAHDLFFDAELAPGTSVLVGHRDKIHAFLCAVLPPEESPLDPYADLKEPAPLRSVRIMIVDEESLTVLSYGTFITVDMDGRDMPEA